MFPLVHFLPITPPTSTTFPFSSRALLALSACICTAMPLLSPPPATPHASLHLDPRWFSRIMCVSCFLSHYPHVELWSGLHKALLLCSDNYQATHLFNSKGWNKPIKIETFWDGVPRQLPLHGFRDEYMVPYFNRNHSLVLWKRAELILAMLFGYNKLSLRGGTGGPQGPTPGATGKEGGI